MSTTSTIAQLVAIIATGVVSDENVVLIKNAAAGIAGKFVTGETISKDEMKVLDFASNRVKKAISKGEAEAEWNAGQVERTKKFEAEMSVHKAEVNKLVPAFLLSCVKLNKKGEIIVTKVPTFENADSAKEFFTAFVATLPAVPKMPTFKGTGTGVKKGTGAKHTIGTPVSGSTNGDIKELIIAAGTTGITRKDLVTALIAKRADKGQKADILGQFVGKAINGGMPQITKLDNGNLVWVEIPTETTK